MEYRSLRLVRGWLGALAATALAAASHTVAGGALPEPALLALILALSGAACTALAGRALSFWRTAAAVLISQGIYHSAFGMLGGHHGGHDHHLLSAGGTGAHAGHLISVDPDALLTGAATQDANAMALGMWIAHVVAAILTILVLRKGGLAVLALMQVLGLAVPRRILRPRPPIASIGPPRLVWVQVPGLPDLGVPLRALRDRGPPVLPAFAS
ncbi:MAG: hypothetical protein ACTHWW_08360 [Arthrobacter sp.]|uniref:hypothetical protein n=1 Tax=unclassified Arthrobacter TaxID=235627 RepID=UPI002651F790|nr:hypothetical protein [Micrococcaceae bacterium]MDN5812773.1 hypothetical protein [Micrococcaceae bacterium]MDN5824449.1 hypothetical protein [Micrococcaceae bacterium]MDN5879100.1 hypothetical protein [Micrococcaceae bacterium]MDN5887460.1 hypothetical protein [Micrococcaceae bacterium]